MGNLLSKFNAEVIVTILGIVGEAKGEEARVSIEEHTGGELTRKGVVLCWESSKVEVDDKTGVVTNGYKISANGEYLTKPGTRDTSGLGCETMPK